MTFPSTYSEQDMNDDVIDTSQFVHKPPPRLKSLWTRIEWRSAAVTRDDDEQQLLASWIDKHKKEIETEE